MIARQKFMFDTDFSVVPIKPEKEPEPDETLEPSQEAEEEEVPPPPTFSEEDLADARQEGFVAGRNAALEDAQTAVENRLSAALESVNANFTTLFETQKRANEETLGDAVAAACVLVRKLLPAYAKTHGLAEIEALAQETVMHVLEEPRIILHVRGDIKPRLEESLTRFAEDKGFEGRIIVIEDETMADGDCRIEWEHGGLTRDTAALWSQIEGIVERNIDRSLPPFGERKDEETHENESAGHTAPQPNLSSGGEAFDPETPVSHVSERTASPSATPDGAPAQGENDGR